MFEEFYASLTPRLSRTALIVSFALAAAAFALFAWLAPHGFELGDAPLYAEYIKNADLSYAPKHIGYYVMGIGITRVVPLPLDYTLNLMSALFAAVSLWLVSAIAFTLTNRVVASVASVIVAASTYLFATNAVNAEIYVVQLAFFLACVLFILRDQPYPAGVAFALAMLLTPSTALAVPFLVLLRPDWRFIARWLGLGAGLTVVALIPSMNEYLWGTHGVLNMPAANLRGAQGLTKEANELWGMRLSLALVAAGFVALAVNPRQRVLLVALAALWLPGLVMGERYSDVPVQVPLYTLLAVVAGVGVAWLAGLLGDRPAVAGALLAGVAALALVGGVPAYRQVTEEAAAIDEYRASVLAMAKTAKPGDVSVAPFATSRLCAHYVPDAPITWIDDEALAGKNGADDQAAAQAALSGAIASKSNIWLPGEFDPSAQQFFESQGYALTRTDGVFVAAPVQ